MRKYFFVAMIALAMLAPIKFTAAQTTSDPTPTATDDQQLEQPVDAENIPPDQFYRATISQVINETTSPSATTGENMTTQKLKVKFTNGDLKGQEQEISNDGLFTLNGGKPLKVGDKVLVYVTSATGTKMFYIADTYRVPALAWMVGSFLLLAVVLSRWKGVASIFGLFISIMVIIKIVIPQIVDGKNPLLMSLIGALIIALVSIYLAHGFNRRTTVALVSTLLTLCIAAGLSIVFVKAGKLFGLGSEEAFYIQQLGTLANLNLQGLLLGGIILGALGVLDDITTAQTASVYEIKRANASLSVRELYASGIRVGREHISSLVNTLFLAYAGASLPLFLFFTVGGSTQPLWVTLNSEFIAEEVVRTLVGSMALMLAVPITTFLAAYYFGRRPIGPASESSQKDIEPVGHVHIH